MADYTFYEGNNATQDNLGSLNTIPGVNYDLKKSGAPIENDEIRSMVLGKGVQAGAALAVYDSPEASMDDDWCVIQVKQNITDAHGYVIGSFEKDQSNDRIYQNYHKDNGLDGKISYLSIYDPWPVPINQATTLLQISADVFEPSGLTLVTSQTERLLYMVSDNGKLALKNLSQSDSDWVSQSFSNDGGYPYGFESLTMAKGELMLGVEGADSDKDQKYPTIMRFDQTQTDQAHPLGKLTGSVWELKISGLDDNAGMEAMTFVPDAYCPTAWGQSSYYGGFFLVALQSQPGKIYVYDLPKGSGKKHTVSSPRASFSTGLLNLKASDMSFDQGTLYVLYDDKIDALTTLTLSSAGVSFANQTMPPIWPAGTPQAGDPVKNCEGIAVSGTTLFLGLDQNDDKLDNYVFQLDQFVLSTAS